MKLKEILSFPSTGYNINPRIAQSVHSLQKSCSAKHVLFNV